ncbi:unnamed protein product [Rotaria sordida]|uniref:Uncharacterized protein n=1 Tax=Rotaria sordida TaxID=392033 RepID=A0A815UXM1_9BILA|nr:unnamed protein product [Rotaria sordida]CAF1246972.1 unnamed protein product [Rotaria sordida]CAF1253504.1 unnamed protein product [Rotaria sordida]CAF1393409.1 unnamed protein product [Rotaria sordida]CAF1515401.1 unnamed protein product [Rotaria sordida]
MMFHSVLLSNRSIDNYNNIHQQPTQQTIIIKNLEQSLKKNKISINNESIPNYYEWSLCDINSAHNDLFNQMSSRHLQTLIYSTNSKIESLSYFNCKKIDEYSLMYDRIIHGDYIYLQQHFGTSQMNRPHPLRNSIPCEETFRWMPVRSSSIIGRRVHLPLDIFYMTSTLTNKKSLKI